MNIQDLRIKLERLEVVRSKAAVNEPSFKELVNGTPLRPRLDLLLEWAIESSTYYSQLSANIFENFKALDYKNEESVTDWIQAFDRDRRKRERIESK